MCRILIVPHINDSTRKAAMAFIKQMAVEISVGNAHGLGYAALDGKGNLFGERWLNNDEGFKRRTSEVDLGMVDKYKGVLTLDGASAPNSYTKFGNVDLSTVTSMTLHARMATSEKGMKNTHPFVSGHTSLIHNGVIQNTSELKMLQSTCDSETILNLYLDHKVADDLNNIQHVADALKGYYACGVYSKDTQGTPILDVFKDGGAKLSAVFIKEIGMVITTVSQNALDAALVLGMTVDKTYTFKDNHIIRIKPMTDETVLALSFDSVYKGSWTYSSSYTGNDYSTSGWEDYRRDDWGKNWNKKKEEKRNKLTVVKKENEVMCTTRTNLEDIMAELEEDGWLQAEGGVWIRKAK